MIERVSHFNCKYSALITFICVCCIIINFFIENYRDENIVCVLQNCNIEGIKFCIVNKNQLDERLFLQTAVKCHFHVSFSIVYAPNNLYITFG